MPQEGFRVQNVLSLPPPAVTPAAKEGKEVQAQEQVGWGGPSTPRAMPPGVRNGSCSDL